MVPIQLNERQGTLVTTLLVLGTIVLAAVAIYIVASASSRFGDIILIFFLAWLLAFILSPIVTRLDRRSRPAAGRGDGPRLRGARSRRSSCSSSPRRRPGELDRRVRRERPALREELPRILALAGTARRDSASRSTSSPRPNDILRGLPEYAGQLVGPLQQLAVASLGAIGNVLLVLILSLYMVVDRDQISAFLFRLVPPSRRARPLLERASPARSAGSSAARRSSASCTRPWRSDERRPRSAVHGRHDSALRRPHGDPVLRALRRLGAAGPRRDPHKARRHARPRSSSWASAGCSS